MIYKPVLFNGQGDFLHVVDSYLHLTQCYDAEIPSGCFMKFVAEDIIPIFRSGQLRMTALGSSEIV